MLVGVPKEIKNHEYRVGLIPGNVRQLVAHGHSVIVQKNAGTAIGLTDEQYAAAGATLVDTAEEIFAKADMIVKVKEPQPHECRMLRPGQVLFTYLHLAPDPEQTELLLASGAICIAYETVTDARGGLPLLAPMSEVAGRMSIQAGAKCLEKSYGGNGILLGGVPGTPAAKVVVIGGGVVGLNAARMAVGLEAEVTVLDKSLDRLRQIDQQYGRRVNTLYANIDTIEQAVLDADLVIGAVLVPGANAPRVVTKEMVAKMRPGSVLVDVSIDQGGCFETSHATTHADPTYVVDGVIHYCVANMPGAVARTSTFALNNATSPFVLALADKGWQQALADDVHLRNGLNVFRGKLTHPALVEEGDARYLAADKAIA
ncbi:MULTISPECIES: alanine dehydrogenase [Nitrospirillum]|uniref:Alanine dehydrogenase n=2 Tax=Nitrospirillum TaxID=1543705 RepID=A0A248JVA4_9PROT|nr:MULTISPECIES: alanine dehydrogenase [Nitrospirillum]ASG22647.1 alanine dehydrogenase [Nitrospirillum amazonense CBAmc]MDG3443960.1 alanine dehydrogenase [Nitrospirillum amazonense]MEA1675005.1 alanine dehydrogenase [Nitrospirillum sp. BR 11163]MEC4594288.1 alanine dehydrogenase [Nitrospirillum amazonense]TWB30158.1 L-alanine dehydrogenase [Nitrospirillum amazonense]